MTKPRVMATPEIQKKVSPGSPVEQSHLLTHPEGSHRMVKLMRVKFVKIHSMSGSHIPRVKSLQHFRLVVSAEGTLETHGHNIRVS